ncbi:aminomethyl-transferring glycine dehydrogenase subunit GcvPB [Candidatus Nitrosacidococcus sp. I8]|uniref:aminomethyl-transferring glycine dehydrogenase subunit GcvPB n=1 Tax=Candidatus Nitrosacidococcus sp. I8 TaxID=2942908 RepID=UPI00222756DC|nr:aminomethyl-transferring glycine dehydrogenase subunit GcvPB [Candidatus Nitrosacidococcus sp. I8]CAH9016673.1 putative glycine dehydrogenase (decarboxylating) subunit 2 [Candidatus Nitrosacidococcus sp. I8]
MLIFESSRPNRHAPTQIPKNNSITEDLPQDLLRKTPPRLPEVSELDVVRHYTRLSQKNFSIDTHFYPLGSCTMKYNPKICHTLAHLPGFLERHPATPDFLSQGYLSCLYELQEILAAITGMKAISLAPMAGAQGEFTGVAMIRAYHDAMGNHERREMLVPDAAHGTNPATATMCGFQVREIPTNAEGDIDLAALDKVLGPKTAGIMLTNPSTLGIFDRNIKTVADKVHQAGGLLYYDGANLNAILGKVKPGDMGFDVIHLNLHKTFATPHGSGGPGAGPVGVGEKLLPFLPIPRVGRRADGQYRWLVEEDCPQSIGRLSAWMGNAGVLLRAYIYIRLLGREGMERVSDFSALNANYLAKRMSELGFDLAYPTRRAGHEFVVTLKRQAQEMNMTATDVAKRLLDLGFHAPTVYFPLLVPECLLIEPAETESKQTLDSFVDAMAQIIREAHEDLNQLKSAPHNLPVRRLDEVKAARELDIAWQG